MVLQVARERCHTWWMVSPSGICTVWGARFQSASSWGQPSAISCSSRPSQRPWAISTRPLVAVSGTPGWAERIRSAVWRGRAIELV
jgi:hypothetical protein